MHLTISSKETPPEFMPTKYDKIPRFVPCALPPVMSYSLEVAPLCLTIIFLFVRYEWRTLSRYDGVPRSLKQVRRPVSYTHLTLPTKA